MIEVDANTGIVKIIYFYGDFDAKINRLLSGSETKNCFWFEESNDEILKSLRHGKKYADRLNWTGIFGRCLILKCIVLKT